MDSKPRAVPTVASTNDATREVRQADVAKGINDYPILEDDFDDMLYYDFFGLQRPFRASMFMYFGPNMYHTSCHFVIFILTCYIHERTLHISCLLVWNYIDVHEYIS
jgi:hypothetical protein